MKSLGYELVSAEYTNSEYNSIRAFWRDPENTEAEDGSELFTESVIEVNDDSFQYKELLELTSLDTIMQDTYVNNQKRVTAFENMVVPIAKERGLVYDLDQGIDSNIYKAIVKALFSEFDPVSQKEQLFMLKMELFNVDFIKEVKDRALKKELRQAPDLMSTVEAACKIYRATKES
jgi:hypothetical protein